MSRAFEKWHGLGNDFVVVFNSPDPEWWISRAGAICDRHRGVGADGILLVGVEPPSMRVINADGSEPEMCGNGIRCVAAALAHKLGQQTGSFDLRTGAGVLHCQPRNLDRTTWAVRVESGTPSFVARDAGVAIDGAEVWLEGQGISGLVGSVGNPHWIFFDHPGAERLAAMGPKLERDDRFARRTNVEFVTRVADRHWRVDVWERGVGITQACATGATTVAAALVRTGRESADVPLTIELPGGKLKITIETDGSAVVEGPAVRVFRGDL